MNCMHDDATNRLKCPPPFETSLSNMIRHLSREFWSGMELNTVLGEIYVRIGATWMCSYTQTCIDVTYIYKSPPLSLSLSPSVPLSLFTLSLSLSLSLSHTSNDILIRPNESFNCSNDLLFRPKGEKFMNFFLPLYSAVRN